MVNKNQKKIDETFKMASQLGFSKCYRQIASCSDHIMHDAKKAGLIAYKKTDIGNDFLIITNLYREKGLISQTSWNVPIAAFCLIGYSHGAVDSERERRGLIKTGTRAKRNHTAVITQQSDKEVFVYPDEISDEVQHVEGAKKQVSVNVFERDAKARSKCIDVTESGKLP